MRIEAIVARWRAGPDHLMQGVELGNCLASQEQGHGIAIGEVDSCDRKLFRDKFGSQGVKQMTRFLVCCGWPGEKGEMGWKGRGFEASG